MIKKLILLGFGLTLLIGLPLAIFVLQNQSTTTTQSGAAPVTKFSLDGPTEVASGQAFDESVMVDPGGQNQVSFIKFAFTYDPAKLDKAADPVTVDTTKYTKLEGPSVTCTDAQCTVAGTLSIGSNQNAVIKSRTSIAVVHFIAKADTDANGTQLAFVNAQNQALSVGGTDQAAENVFQGSIPKTIIIGSQATTTPETTTVTPGGGGTDNGGGGNGLTGGSGGSGANGTGALSVSCTSFTADKTTGNPPLIVTFTTIGTSTTDSITKLDITYGDGTTDTVASGSGMGTGNINNQISHTYSGNGTFTASALLTTAGGATSNVSSCKQTITIGTTSATTEGLPPTGPGDTVLLIGGIAGLVTAIGAILILSL